jgi:hypothetical protein
MFLQRTKTNDKRENQNKKNQKCGLAGAYWFGGRLWARQQVLEVIGLEFSSLGHEVLFTSSISFARPPSEFSEFSFGSRTENEVLLLFFQSW